MIQQRNPIINTLKHYNVSIMLTKLTYVAVILDQLETDNRI